MPRPTVLPFVAAAAAAPSGADLRRAQLARPAAASGVSAATPAGAFAAMNAALRKQPVRTAECASLDHAALDAAARALHAARDPGLDALYQARGDRRALHFEGMAYKERLWRGEGVARGARGRGGGTAWYNSTRDGKCAEAAMWWTHHLTQPARGRLAARPDFALPLLPNDVSRAGGHEYAAQISCVDCHVALPVPGAPPPVPGTLPPHSGPQYPMECPVDEATGKPSVWYDRTKRCDWDYEPACQPCEGIGGLTWGNGEGEYNPMPCAPLMTPDQIPADNLTTVIWPKSFSVKETNSLTFPGTDPCVVKFKNSTDMLYFDTRADGPHLVNFGLTGGTGPSPLPGKAWDLPNGNFYTYTAGFCVCLSPQCTVPPCPSDTVTGPLPYDFAKGAKLVGRERIVPEYIEREMVADHWVKGPHHFWVEVATNLMVREWQPFNGHQIWQDWNLTTPDASFVDVPKSCYTGLLHTNISCIAPPPTA